MSGPRPDETERERLRDAPDGFVAFWTADRGYAEGLAEHRAVHVVRDPRDIVVSAYFSHLHSHSTDLWPELAAHRERLRSMPKTEGLMLEIEFRTEQLAAMRDWDYGQEHVLEMRFEELVRGPYASFLRMLTFLDLLDEREPGGPRRLADGAVAALRSVESRLLAGESVLPRPGRISVERLARCVFEHDFSRKSGGRGVGEEDVRSHYRKGVPGDWPCVSRSNSASR